jgi:diacylglycerol kinase
LKSFNRFLRGRFASFKPAFDGWAHVWAWEPNSWIHAAITLVVIFLGFWLGISRTDWLAIVLAAGIVWLAEFFNSALEAIVDLASPRRHKLARVAKDVSAGAVVIAALTALVVGLLVFWPPLSARLGL